MIFLGHKETKSLYKFRLIYTAVESSDFLTVDSEPSRPIQGWFCNYYPIPVYKRTIRWPKMFLNSFSENSLENTRDCALSLKSSRLVCHYTTCLNKSSSTFRIRSYSRPDFSHIFPHLDWIRENKGKIRTRITPNTDSFYAVKYFAFSK